MVAVVAHTPQRVVLVGRVAVDVQQAHNDSHALPLVAAPALEVAANTYRLLGGFSYEVHHGCIECHSGSPLFRTDHGDGNDDYYLNDGGNDTDGEAAKKRCADDSR